MTIIKEQTTEYKYAFVYDFNYEVLTFCRTLKIKYGSKNFGFCHGKWRFSNLGIGQLIMETYPEVVVESVIKDDLEIFNLKVKEEERMIQRATELKKATTSNIILKNVKGEPYPYQKVGVEFFINNNGKAILADTMGLGKTCQALAYIAHNDLKKTLVICPSVVKYSWENEVKKWTKLKPYVIDSKSKFEYETIANHQVFIINYDILKKFLKQITLLRWDCLICDEVQYIKNSSSIRSKATREIARRIPSLLLLSGTPLLNRPVELYNALNLIDPFVWHDWYGFTKRYCGGHQGDFGWEYKGATNIKELREKIGRYFLRRTKEDVLKELPSKTLINLPMNLDKGSRTTYDYAEKSFIEYLKEIKKKNSSQIKKSIQAIKLVKLNELRQITTEGKMKVAKEFIKDIIRNDEKVVVFSVYNKPLEELKEYFKDDAVIITGKVSDEERKESIRKFQDSNEAKIFLGGMKSAGVGITLTSASNVLLIDFSWVPADHEQAADRCHRISQANPVTVYQLFARDTIDEYMTELLRDKKMIFNELMEGADSCKINKTNIIHGLIKRLQKK